MTRKIAIILTIVLVASLCLNTNLLLADNQQAEKFYQKGEEYYNLGIKYHSISRLKKAQKYFTQCAEIDTDYKSVKQHLSSLEEIIKLREENWGLKIHKLEKRPLPHSIYEAKGQYDIKVRGGASSAAIIKVHGQPSSDRMLQRYNPPVMRSMMYNHHGLEFLLNRNRLCSININSKFHGKVFSLSIGNPISRAIDIYGDDYSTSDSHYFDSDIYYVWKKQLPNWSVYTKDDIIVGFKFFDKSIHGNWMPQLVGK